MSAFPSRRVRHGSASGRFRAIGVVCRITAVALAAGGGSAVAREAVEQAPQAGVAPPAVLVLNDPQMRLSLENGMGRLIEAGDCTPFVDLLNQGVGKTSTLDLERPRTELLDPETVYERCKKATVMISTFFHCPDPKCKRWHSNVATGFLIHASGIVVTNQHLLGAAQPGSKFIGVRTFDGKVYSVKEVLAADSKTDVAVLRLATERTDFPVLALGEDPPVGRKMMLVSHPGGQYYTFSQGYVSRHSIDPYTKSHVMHVTADFGKGSSGGAFFDPAGNVVGMVESTKALDYSSLQVVVDADNSCLRKATSKEINGRGKTPRDQRPKSIGFGHQMTFNRGVPVSSIHALIQEKP